MAAPPSIKIGLQLETPPITPDNEPLPSFSKVVEQATDADRHDVQLFPDHPRHDSPLAPLFQQTLVVPNTTINLKAEYASVRRYWDSNWEQIERSFGQYREANRVRFLPQPTPSPVPRDPLDEKLVLKLTRRQRSKTDAAEEKGLRSGPSPRLSNSDATVASDRTSATPPLPNVVASAPTTLSSRSHKRKRSTAQDGDNQTVTVKPGRKRSRSSVESTEGKKSKHSRAGASKEVEDGLTEDQWAQLEDFSPPLSSIGDDVHALPVAWKDPRKDMSGYPDWDQLAPAEKELCDILRLTPQKYLLEKRRIFKAYVKMLKTSPDKHFGRTAAQVACATDVNKISQMWEAFSKVGWFQKKWFEQYLS